MGDAGGRILDEVFNDLPQFFRHDDPADAPAGHRPVLGEGVDEDDAIVGLHDIKEGSRAATTIIEMRVDLVGHDPETLAPRDVENGAQIIKRRGPAGRIGGRVDEDAAGFGPIALSSLLRSSFQAPPANSSSSGFAIAPETSSAAEMFGQEGVR